jgi:ribosome recycling factor
MKNDKSISEDDCFSFQDDVQKITDEYIKKSDDLTNEKEKEILEF